VSPPTTLSYRSRLSRAREFREKEPGHILNIDD
jgi:hypothetical protein